MKTPKYKIGDKLFYLWKCCNEYAIQWIRPTGIELEDGQFFYREKSKQENIIICESFLFKDKEELFNTLKKVCDDYIPR
jgi:hypothetical protein